MGFLLRIAVPCILWCLGEADGGAFSGYSSRVCEFVPVSQGSLLGGGYPVPSGLHLNSWYGCREAPCRQLAAIPAETMLSALEALLQPPTETRPTP
jgi:hypothetical protein